MEHEIYIPYYGTHPLLKPAVFVAAPALSPSGSQTRSKAFPTVPPSAAALHPPSSPPTFCRKLRRCQEYQSYRQGLGRWTRHSVVR